MWHFTIYTDDLPDGVGGEARGPVIRIRTKYRQDEGIHAHELEHVRQWWVTLGIHSLLYLVVRRYRLWAEVQAYREQMRHQDRHGGYLSLESAAARLANPRYRLGITIDQAKVELEIPDLDME